MKFSFKRSHALVAALSLLAGVVIVKEAYPAILTAGLSKKTLHRFVLHNSADFTKALEVSPGVPYIVPTKRRFVLTEVVFTNQNDSTPNAAGLMLDPLVGTSRIIGDIRVPPEQTVSVQFSVGPQLTAGQGLSLINAEGVALDVYIAGYEEKG